LRCEAKDDLSLSWGLADAYGGLLHGIVEVTNEGSSGHSSLRVVSLVV